VVKGARARMERGDVRRADVAHRPDDAPRGRAELAGAVDVARQGRSDARPSSTEASTEGPDRREGISRSMTRDFTEGFRGRKARTSLGKIRFERRCDCNARRSCLSTRNSHHV
jgi:hypothetical protein